MASRVGVNLRASAYLHQGDRKYMEDEFQVAYQRTHDKKDIEYAFFGIFDGHGGKEAAHFAKDNLMDNIVSQRLFWSESDEDVLCAIKEGFLQTHMAMWKELDQWPRTASGWPSTSGTTASIAFIRRQKIYIGHVGDSGIVLGFEDDNNEWVGENLTNDHKPENLNEKNRITECGGKVIAKSGVPRVVWNRPKSGHQGPVRRSTPMDEIPFLAVARSLGDLWSYNATNNQFVVSPEPDVYVIDIDINIHRCLVFGTDGLWNALSPCTAVNIAYNSEKNNEKHYLGVPMECGKQRLWINPSRCIVSGALERYQRVGLRADNTSAVTVYLDPPGRPKREVLLQQLALKKGSNSRNASLKPPSKKVREASVKVHVYNQSCRPQVRLGLLCIKERFPDEKANRNSNPNKSCSSQEVKGTDTSHLPQENSVSSAVKDSTLENEEKKEEISNPCSACGECGCVNYSSRQTNFKNSSSVDDSSAKNIPSNILSNKTNNNCNTTKVKNDDDIQIPLVSSSTSVSEFDQDTSKSSAKNNNKSEVTKFHLNSSKRRTRSCASLPLQVKSENKKDIRTSSSGGETNKAFFDSGDACSRILKSVNRGSVLASSILSLKRKRAKELQQDEPTSKSLRVHTRSRTLSHKPMITRSQDKNKKK